MSVRQFPLLGIGLLLVGLLVSTPNAVAHGGAHGEEAEEEPESEELARVPYNGAVIRIVSPANGLVCPGRHGNRSLRRDNRLNEVLYGLAPGEHRIEVLLADGEHRDLQEGDAITVFVQ